MKPFENISPLDFTYDLPEDRIAAYPADTRDKSRLLILQGNDILTEDIFSNIAGYLPLNGHLFYNNSRVIPARLVFPRETGSHIEIFCLKPYEPADYALSLSSGSGCIWECMVGNLKKFNTTEISLLLETDAGMVNFTAKKISSRGNIVNIQFNWNDTAIGFGEILRIAGRTPLPPYIKRDPVSGDRERYQTIYSRKDGSVAAPTAGLHFTENVFQQITKKNISCHEITLHVGAGTFQPVKTHWIRDHEMHAEYFEVTHDMVQNLATLNIGVICVGTTTVRTLESLYWIGVKLLCSQKPLTELILDQWEAYSLPQQYSVREACNAIEQWLEQNKLQGIMASTRLLIVPGYRFRTTEILITNFHQPGSTLLLLIAAFIGNSWKQAYQYALDHGFRFLSYGDSSLLFRPALSSTQ